jgi:hypothetical protein
MSNWDDLIITLLVIIFTFGGGVKELLRRRRSAERWSRPQQPKAPYEGDELPSPETEERSPTATTPMGEPQSWQDILEMLRPKEVQPEQPASMGQQREPQPSSPILAEPSVWEEDDEFREPGSARVEGRGEGPKTLLSSNFYVPPPAVALAGKLPKRDLSFNLKNLRHDWARAVVLREILGPPKGLNRSRF